MDDRNEKLKANMLALFKLFDNATELIVSYMIKNEAFTEDFQDKLLSNNTLTQLSTQDDVKPPFFTDQTQMSNYYNTLFTDYNYKQVDPKPIPFKDSQECLLSQLEEALKNEDYEKAALIRDYAKDVKINLQ